MRPLVLAIAAVCVLAPGAVCAQDSPSEDAARAIALLRKGRPPHIPAEEWRGFRLILIAGLGEDRSASAVATPFLVETLKDPDPEVGAVAAGALVRIEPGRGRPDVYPVLDRALRSPSRGARDAAFDALSAFRPMTAAAEALLVEDLGSRRAGRWRAADQLRAIPADRITHVLKPLVAALADTEQRVRLSAIETLASFETLAVTAGSALRRLRADSDSRVVAAASAALDRVDPQADPAARRTLLDNRTPDSPVRSRVVPESDVATALRQFQSADRALRLKGLAAIEAHREDASAAVPALVAALRSADVEFRFRVAYALTAVAPLRAAPALPVLKEMLRSDAVIPNTSPRILAQIGLGWLGDAGAQALVDALRDRSPQTRQAAAAGLFNSDVFPESAVASLIMTARDKDESVRLQSLATLASRQADPARVIPALRAALHDASHDVRSVGASGLANYGSAARDAVPDLRLLASGDDAGIVFDAQTAVAAIEPESAVAFLPFFISEISGRSPGTFAIGRPGDALGGPARRLNAISAIESLGPRARAALPALRLVWERDDRLFQLAAGMAMLSVDPDLTPDIVAAFSGALRQNDDGETHYGVLVRLKLLGPRAAAAETAITMLLRSDDPDVRRVAAEALAAIGAK